MTASNAGQGDDSASTQYSCIAQPQLSGASKAASDRPWNTQALKSSSQVKRK